MHEQANSNGSAPAAANHAPMADPFPSLTEDPFLAMSNGEGHANANGGLPAPSRKSAQTSQPAQPDL